MWNRIGIMTVFMLSGALFFYANGETPEEFFNRMEKEYRQFSDEVNADYNSFRDKVNNEYAEFLARPWTKIPSSEPLKRPPMPEPGPFICPPDDETDVTEPVPVTVIEMVPSPVPAPRPQPIEPLIVNPDEALKKLRFDFYGTPVEIPQPEMNSLSLLGHSNEDFANAWRKLSSSSFTPLLKGCLDVREELKLPDWHYLLLADKVASLLSGNNQNLKTLLTGFLLNQSGYDVRFAFDYINNRLHLLFNSSGTFYGRLRYQVGSEWYYTFTLPEGGVRICEFSTPGERPLSVAVDCVPNLSYKPSSERTVNVYGHPELTLSVTTNKNLIDFLGDYPDASLTKSNNDRWSAHARMPSSNEIKEQIYPRLRKAIEGKNQYDALSILLKVAQSFPYEYDDKLWGKDRVFFMDESWYYPYSDCEDHAINFVHLVKDLMGLETALVVYPEHLSAAVAITDGSAKGDYLEFKGKRFTPCDGTYFYGAPGAIAPAYRNRPATLVPVK